MGDSMGKKLLDDIVINGKEYILVDFIEYNGIYYNCYLCDNEYLFTTNNNGKEIIIIDEKIIESIKNQEGLNYNEVLFSINSHITDSILENFSLENINDEVKNMIIELFIKKLIDLDKNIKYKDALENLKKVRFFYGDIRKTGNPFYHPASNSIVVPKASINDIISFYFHEMIHACGGPKFNQKLSLSTGLNEGATEITTQRMLNKYDTTSGHNKFTRFYTGNGSSYSYQVSLISQMEYLTGTKVTDSIINGNMDFFSNFKDLYGKKIYSMLSHRSTRLISGLKNKTSDYHNDYFMETQNSLLVMAFEKDFKEVNDLESANKFMKKLSGFEKTMGIDTIKKENNIFYSYYIHKLDEVINLLRKNNIKEEEIVSFRENNRYQPIVFRNERTIQEDKINALKINSEILPDLILEGNMSINKKDLELFIGANNEKSCYILTNKGEIMTYIDCSLAHAQIYFNDFLKNVFPKLKKTEFGFILEDNDKSIELSKVDDEISINRLIEIVNKKIQIKTCSTTDLIIQNEELIGKSR